MNNLDDLQAIAAGLGEGARATVRYFALDDPRSTQLRSFTMDRKWFLSGRCRRDDQVGLWNCTDLPDVAPAPPPPPASTALPTSADLRLKKLTPSLVFVTYDMPYSVSGATETNFHGTGLIVDAVHGLVVVDRNTVPVSVGMCGSPSRVRSRCPAMSCM